MNTPNLNEPTDFMQPEQPAPQPVTADGWTAPDEATAASFSNGHNHDAEPVPEGEPAEIVDIAELDAQMEELPEAADPARMEDRMAYAPHLTPGKAIDAIFALAEPPWESRLIKGKPIAQFNYQLTELREDSSTGKVIKFLQANMFRSGKMESSRVDDLLFALGKIKDFNRTGRKASDAFALLQEATAMQIVVRGVIQWRRYDKATGETWSTAPQKPFTKNDGTVVAEKLWPKGIDGKFQSRVEGWDGNYGNETVSRVMPTADTLAAYKAAA